jgi:hypothetical protein
VYDIPEKTNTYLSLNKCGVIIILIGIVKIIQALYISAYIYNKQ